MFINALNLFSWKGRICRWQFFVALIFAIFIVVAFERLAYYMQNPDLVIYALMVSFFLLLSAQIKRLHDIGLNGLFVLLLFVPMVGELSILALLFVPGTEGANKYGEQSGRKSTVNNEANAVVQKNQDFTQEEIKCVLETIHTSKQINRGYIGEILNSSERVTAMLDFLQQNSFIQMTSKEKLWKVNIKKIQQYLENETSSKEPDSQVAPQEEITNATAQSPFVRVLIRVLAIGMIIVCVSGIVFIFKNTFFRQAVSSHHNNIAKVFLKMGANVDSCFIVDRGNALSKAINKRETDVIQTLLDWGANIEEGCDSEYTPLMIAINNGDMETTKMLLKAGANPNAERENTSPLISAAKKFDIGMLKLLQDNGVDIKNSKVLSGMLKSQANTVDPRLEETVAYLISQKVDVKKNDNEALLLATRGKNTKVVEMLIKAGANVNANEKGANLHNIPLWIAVEQNNLQMAEVLLRHGAHIKLPKQNHQNFVPYILTAAKNNQEEMVHLLVKYGDNVNSMKDDYTPLWYAVGNGNISLAEWLINKGAKVNLRTEESKQTVLMYAASKGDMEMVELLLRKGANAKLSDNEGRTARDFALWYAVENGNISLAERLINKGAKVNLRTGKSKQTVLMYAASKGDMEMVKLLLRKGAYAKLSDNEGHTARDFALKHNYQKVADLLAQKDGQTYELCKDIYRILTNSGTLYYPSTEEEIKMYEFFIENDCARLLAETEQLWGLYWARKKL